MKGQFPLHTPIERNLSPRWFRSPQEDDDDEWAPSNMVPALPRAEWALYVRAEDGEPADESNASSVT